jgi:predicted membrane-bound mannosyltransferase
MPMHADEAVQAARLSDLLAGTYQYDPNDYHGPVLLYSTVPAVLAGGARDFAGFTEPMLRAVPAIAGGALAFASACFWLPAGLLMALSPAMVFYSRYFIPEILFVLISFGFVVAGWNYLRQKVVLAAVLTGAVGGLMFATKETAVLVVAAALAAGARGVPRYHWLLAALSALATGVLLLGPVGTILLAQSYATVWASRATQSLHEHPWWFYLNLLGRTEGVILAIAAVSLPAAWKSGGLPRFLAVQTLLLLVLYSVIPYKTPWCALGVLHGTAMIAGFGLSRLKPWATLAVLGLAFLIMGRANAPQVWSYAATSTDVFRMADRLRSIEPSARIQVISSRNLWPLPWYLRRHHNAGWRKDVPQDGLAPIILCTPEVEDSLVHAMYELPPPGQRYLYRPMFEQPVILRNGVELRGYVRE